MPSSSSAKLQKTQSPSLRGSHAPPVDVKKHTKNYFDAQNLQCELPEPGGIFQASEHSVVDEGALYTLYSGSPCTDSPSPCFFTLPRSLFEILYTPAPLISISQASIRLSICFSEAQTALFPLFPLSALMWICALTGFDINSPDSICPVGACSIPFLVPIAFVL